MDKSIKSLLFAVILCVVCSVLLTAASTGLKSRRQRNLAVDRQKNILMAMGLIQEDVRLSQEDVQNLYRQAVKSVWVDEAGQLDHATRKGVRQMPLYVLLRDNRIDAYVVPVNTRGLWGKIHGYLAIENDGTTIRGFTVYKHSETPGLGGEIESRWFRENFANKRLVDAGGNFVSIGIAKGSVEAVVPKPRQANYVDGISGATLTGKLLSSGLKEILRDYEPMAIEFRQKNRRYLRMP